MKEERKHILIIDDDKGIRESVKEYLESENFFVTTAKDSQDAKNKIKLLEFPFGFYDNLVDTFPNILKLEKKRKILLIFVLMKS